MNYQLITLILIIFLGVNIYLYFMQKKQIYINQKMVDEEKVKQYLLYLTSIIETKDKELEELQNLQLESPEDKSLSILISQKIQEKDAVKSTIQDYVDAHSDSVFALKTGREFLIKEKESLEEKLDTLNQKVQGRVFQNPPSQSDEMLMKIQNDYRELKKKYEQLLQEYDLAKKRIDLLDDEFTKLNKGGL